MATYLVVKFVDGSDPRIDSIGKATQVAPGATCVGVDRVDLEAGLEVAQLEELDGDA